MRVRDIASLLLGCAGAAHAFKDTSPLFFLSTADLQIIPDSLPQIQQASDLTGYISAISSRCLSTTYIIASQPGVNAADFASRHSAPHLKKGLAKKDGIVRESFSVTDVVGQIDADQLQVFFEKQCGAGIMHVDASTGSFEVVDDAKPRVIRVNFPPLTQATHKDRVSKLAENDAFLSSLISTLPSQQYTLILTTTPSTNQPSENGPATHPQNQYEFSDSSALHHMDLKRSLSSNNRASPNTDTRAAKGNSSSLPLFQRYQYFTPGIFMGLLVTALLGSILLVAMYALGSLKVSYVAFEKEMGPQGAAGKKQQ
ncbi:MAG: hypothetical protein M1819_003611 [Sarea resinae]|nr:MAG: hypothetical protein M1819_003611 [Sarea resinae]